MRDGFGITKIVMAVLAFSGAHAVAQPAEPENDVETITVVGSQDAYFDRDVDTGSKIGADIFDMPSSLTVINATFLNDLRAETVADAYPYILGLSQSGINANNFTLRGLTSDLQSVQVNGLPGLASRFGSPTTANVERIEVLKGPASVLYGLMEPGGLVNIITKRPEADFAAEVYLTGQIYAGGPSGTGTNAGGTATFDVTGPIDRQGRWLFRMIGSLENVSSFRDGVGYENYYLFPSLSYVIDPHSRITVGVELLKEESDADDGLVAVNNDVDLTAPINVRYQEDGDFDNDKGLVLFAVWDQALSERWALHVNWRSTFHEDQRRLFENNRVNDTEDPLEATLRRRDRHQLNKREYHFLDARLTGRFRTGSIEHTLLIGVNGGFERADFERIRFGSAITPNISVFDPEFGIGVPSAITNGTDRITDEWNYGFYVQDVARVTDWLILMLGGRYESQSVDFIEQNSGREDKQTTDAFVPSGGIIFQPTENLSLYASYSESFDPASVERRDVLDNPFDPERGRQYEIGVKSALWDGRANLTVAAFDIRKTNITERNVDREWELLGELHSQGIEFEFQVLPIPNWQIRIGYAYVDSIVADSANAAVEGNSNAFAPKHDGFVWTRYNIPNEVLGGLLGISLGVNFESARFTSANAGSRVRLPGYARVDIGVYFDVGNLSFALNVENLFDKRYFTGGTNDTRLYPGDPRLITLSLRAGF